MPLPIGGSLVTSGKTPSPRDNSSSSERRQPLAQPRDLDDPEPREYTDRGRHSDEGGRDARDETAARQRGGRFGKHAYTSGAGRAGRRLPLLRRAGARGRLRGRRRNDRRLVLPRVRTPFCSRPLCPVVVSTCLNRMPLALSRGLRGNQHGSEPRPQTPRKRSVPVFGQFREQHHVARPGQQRLRPGSCDGRKTTTVVPWLAQVSTISAHRPLEATSSGRAVAVPTDRNRKRPPATCCAIRAIELPNRRTSVTPSPTATPRTPSSLGRASARSTSRTRRPASAHPDASPTAARSVHSSSRASAASSSTKPDPSSVPGMGGTGESAGSKGSRSGTCGSPGRSMGASTVCSGWVCTGKPGPWASGPPRWLPCS